MYNKYLDASNCVYTDTKENKMSLNDYNSKMPEFPGIEHVLATAEKMYAFVSKK